MFKKYVLRYIKKQRIELTKTFIWTLFETITYWWRMTTIYIAFLELSLEHVQCTCQLHKKEKIATKLLYLSPIQSNKCLWSSRTMNILKLDQSSIDCLKTSGQEEASLIQQNWSIPDYYYYYYIHTIGPPSTTSRTVQSKFIANLEFICQWPHILFVPSRALWQMKIDRVVPDALRQQQQGGVFGCCIR